MRYNADAYSYYPVLRPHSSDFPTGQLNARLTVSREESELMLRLEFSIEEPAIAKHIAKADALCCAMVYCTETCYTEMLKAPKKELVITGSIPLNMLSGKVEVHPSVIAEDAIAIEPDTVNDEYGNNPISVNKRRRLAMDEPYHFEVGYVPPIESVFKLQPTEAGQLEDWEFNIAVDILDRYIVISANPDTFAKFTELRSNVPLTTATIYLNALTNALGELPPEEDDAEPVAGWARSVRALMKRQNINRDQTSISLAAQRLLNTPFSYLNKEEL